MLSLSTSTGIILHETKVDKLTVLAVSSPVRVAKKVSKGGLLDNTPHTHSDTGVIESSARELRTQKPSTTPRRDRDEKYRLGKKVPRGFYLFDSYYLPLDRITL